MKKKPLLIYIIALAHLLIPLWYGFQINFLFKKDVLNWASYDAGYLGLMSLWAIAAGVGIFLVSRVGLGLMIAHALWILTSYIILAVREAGLPIYLISFGVGTALLAVSLPFLLKNIFSPFFNPRLRWWKTPPRFVVKAENALQAQCLENCSIYDINRHGCYLMGDLVKAYQPGQEVEFTLFHQEKEVKVKGAVVWVNAEPEKSQKPQGMGVRFLKTDRQSGELIKALVDELDRAGKVAR